MCSCRVENLHHVKKDRWLRPGLLSSKVVQVAQGGRQASVAQMTLEHAEPSCSCQL